MSLYEKMEMDMATAIQSYAALLGIEVSVLTGGLSISSMMQAGSAAIKMAAMLVSDEGSRAGRKAQLIRHLVAAALQDIEIQKSEARESSQVELWYRTKYTNEQLYGWMEKSEALYDMDFPGYYMRHIRSLLTSIPAVVAPYSGVNATLTLLQHRYSVSSSPSNAAEYEPATPENEESFRTDRIPTKSIAVSSGVQDAGYMALDGGPCLRAAANQSIQNMTRSSQAEGRDTGFSAMWDLKNDFANE
ncbi:toxin subunit [Fusarium pseudoanthophilum]|uniref:Toxin subunit n=1 Tax=Fusarium pseudoanthophilum TaxID=48495 RepID=A0A8H5NL63_9HYPO|nr:toxin subunit [Fusarium pseudoanthophilum]